MIERAIIGLCASLPRGGFTLARLARRFLPGLAQFPVRLKCADIVLRGDVAHNIFYTLVVKGHYSHQAVEDDLLAMLAGKAHRIVDVGANIGYTAALMADHAPAGARITAYEPLPLCLPYVVQVAERFPNVEVVQKAIGDAPGRAQFLQRRSIDRSSFAGKGEAPVSSTINVDVVTLDDECAGMDPDLIKIDVEGFEPAVLNGAKATIARARPIVVFEAYEKDVLDFAIAYFERTIGGYVLYAISSGGSLRLLETERGADPDTCNFVAWPQSRGLPESLDIPRTYER